MERQPGRSEVVCRSVAGAVVVCFRFVLNCPFASETLLPCEMRSDYELPLADHVKQSIRRLHLSRSPFLLVDDKGWTNTP
jgi:hypothetical protein